MARPWRPRTFACLAVVCGLTATLVAGPAMAGEGAPDPAPSPRAAVDVPVDASATTRTAVQTAEQRLSQLQTEVAQTALDYKSAQARLSLARQTVTTADQQAFAAEQAAAQAGTQLGQYAAHAYMGGPMMGTAAILDSDDAAEMLHVAGMLDIVGDSQTGALDRLRLGRADALAAADRARTARQAAGVAKAEATALIAQAKRQMAETVTLLEQLQVRAHHEASQARAERAASLANARIAALSSTGGIGDLPAAATSAGPTPGLPEEAGPDPGDGEPGPDHLRPRAERALLLVQDLFGITDIGGWRQSDAISSDHPQGRAIDVMLTTVGALPDPTRVELGWRIARWAQSNSAGLGVTYVIWQGRIWSVARSAEGWRDYTVNFPYGTNVSPTTLHMDHVHISFG